MGEEEMRRGLWSEQEDVQLVYYVKLFGDRKWDFISKVSGLKRTGKSCRLRWVNYLDPGLKRGKMTSHEEKLIIQLHSKWGNRWSRIAGKLPGRTDNEIKNFWRTYMRHKAQEKKRGISTLPSSSTSSSSLLSSESHNQSNETILSSSASMNSFPTDSNTCLDTKIISFYDTGGLKIMGAQDGNFQNAKVNEKEYSMDDIWRDIDESQNNCDLFYSRMDSPIWNFSPDVLWAMDTDDTKSFPLITDQIFGSYDQVVNSSLVG